MARKNTYAIENAEIGFRNFDGKEGPYNKEGDRSFAVFLREEDRLALEEQGYNIKQTKAVDDDGNPSYYLNVSVAFGNYPPKIVLITSKAKTVLEEDMLSLLDYSDIENVDLVLNPYHWSVNGNSGVKAYVKSMYVTLEEDEFTEKYADLEEL